MTGFRRRNLRKKTDNDENDDADATVQPILNTAPQQSSIGAKLAALKKPALSFDEEEDAAEVAAKQLLKEKRRKEKRNKKLAADAPAILSAAPPSREAETGPGASRGGGYSAADLKALRAATLTADEPPPNDPELEAPPQQEVRAPDEPMFRLAGSFRGLGVAPPSAGASAPSTSATPAGPATSLPATAAPAKAPHPLKGRAGDVDLSRLPADVDLAAVRDGRELIVDGELVEEEGGSGSDGEGAAGMPSMAQVRAARARRERLRRAGLGGDYVHVPGGAMGPGGDEGEEREAREDESGGESGEGSEEEGPRTAFGLGLRRGGPEGDRSKVYAMEQRGTGDAEMDFDDSQMLRALRGGQLSSLQQRAQAAAAREARGGQGASVEDVWAALEGGVERLRLQEAEVAKRADRTRSHMASTLDDIEGLEKGIKEAGERYEYLQSLKGDLDALADCLRDKGAVIEEMEAHMMRLFAECAEDMARAEAEMQEEEVQLGHRVVRAAMQAIASGADSARVAAAASQEWEAAEAEALSGASVPAETDEFGRDKNVLRRRAAVARAEARKAGRGEGGGWARAAVGQWGGKAASKEHLETFARRREEIVKTVPAVFADVDDRFSSLGAVKSILEEWKRKYPDSYRDSFAAEAVPVLFAPFVRLEVQLWDPLFGSEGSSRSFEEQEWYRLLFDYGMGDGAAEDDPDADLMPRLVEQLALPFLLELARSAWDPADPKQAGVMAAAVSDMLVYLPPDAAGLGELLTHVQSQLSQRLDIVKLPPWPAAALLACPQLERLASQLFSDALAALWSACRWVDVLRPAVLAPILGAFLERTLLPALHALMGGPSQARDARAMATCVGAVEDSVASVPKQLLASPDMADTLRPLRQLASDLAASLEANSHGALASRVRALPL